MPLFISGNLIPLLKKDGDPTNLRPIVVGETFRRLISKICVSFIKDTARTFLQPYQYGVGVPGGVEAIIHAFNRIIRYSSLPPDFVLTLIDFSNAFNEINRTNLLHQVHRTFPQIFPWVQCCYSIGAPLFLGNGSIIYATTGIQQGDPLSSILFSLVLQPFLVTFHSHYHLLSAAYLDDVTLGGSLFNSLAAIEHLLSHGPEVGLILSPKTIIWSPTQFPIDQSIPSNFSHLLSSTPPPFTFKHDTGVPLLGGSISLDSQYFDRCAHKRLHKAVQQTEVMRLLADPQLEFQLFRSCLSTPKLHYSLVTSPPQFINSSLVAMESFVNDTLCHILADANFSTFTQFQFQLATLPTRHGGLGILNPMDLSKFVFIASYESSLPVQNLILSQLSQHVLFPCSHIPFEDNNATSLPPPIVLDPFPEYLELKQQFQLLYLPLSSTLPPCNRQSYLSSLYYASRANALRDHPYITTQPKSIQLNFKGIISSFKVKSTSQYLYALPNAGLQQVMTKQEFHVHMALRLMMPIFPPNMKCNRPTCSFAMDIYGHHALCCTGKSMFSRHELVAWSLLHLASAANLHPQWKASVSCLGSSWHSNGISKSGHTQFRPADLLFPSPWWDSKPTCVDVTVVSPISARTPVHFTPGKAAAHAEGLKISKHLTPCELAGFLFLPFAVDCFGVFAPEAHLLLKKLQTFLISSKNYPPYLAHQLIYRRVLFAIHLGTCRQIISRLSSP
jgi:hypothetical protein